MQTLLELFTKARRVSVPIVVVTTADQVETLKLLARAPDQRKYAMVQWDANSGLTPVQVDNSKESVAEAKASQKAIDAAKALAGLKPTTSTAAFADAMFVARQLEEGATVYVLNAQRQFASNEPLATAQSVQSVCNLRNDFKRNFRMLVLLTSGMVTPPEFAPDIVSFRHALPTVEESRAMIVDTFGSGNLQRPPDEVLDKAVDAVSGLPMFSAEQQVAMALTVNGLDLPALWEGKRVAIEATPGLSVYRGAETLDDLRGLDSVKSRLRQHIRARTPVGVVVWIDEGADVFSNVEQDTSGVKTDQQRQLLVDMEQHNWRGMIAVGVPGSGKSAIARGFGNEAGVPTIQVDFGGMESKYVGESETNLRRALDVVKAIGRGHAFFILTCNSLKGIRPQFQRRFKRGIFFFDLPTKAEREAIWALYLKRYEIPKQPRPDDHGWTGAEIRECCESAWDTGGTLVESARFIVPVSRSRFAEINAMRKEADGRFLDASKPGPYTYEPEPMSGMAPRAIALGSLDDALLGASLAHGIRKES